MSRETEVKMSRKCINNKKEFRGKAQFKFTQTQVTGIPDLTCKYELHASEMNSIDQHEADQSNIC